MSAHRTAVRQLPLFALRVPGVTMRTTGLASMGGLYEGDDLASALADARERTLAIYAHLDLARLEVPRLAIVNPPVWELAHIAWFQERWCQRYVEGRALRPSRLEGADRLFDSSAVAHATRWSLDYPPLIILQAYLRETLEATLERLAHATPEERYFFELALLHEDMHGEALLMTLQTLALPAPGIALVSPRAEPAHDIAFGGGTFLMGSPREAGRFVFDNEKWAHEVAVEPFAMASAPVTAGEFAAFVEEGGYRQRGLWSEAGWAWRSAAAREAPLYWRREGTGWSVRRFDHWQALQGDEAMRHVTLHEAQAYCRWTHRRLPTEAEWEFAATREGPLGPRQMGAVWEWTASPFDPYPGFSADPYAEYSQPWFHTHYVLRGASFATRCRLAHPRFRNFYLPERGDVFAGMRTCPLGRATPVS